MAEFFPRLIVCFRMSGVSEYTSHVHCIDVMVAYVGAMLTARAYIYFLPPSEYLRCPIRWLLSFQSNQGSPFILSASCTASLLYSNIDQTVNILARQHLNVTWSSHAVSHSGLWADME